MSIRLEVYQDPKTARLALGFDAGEDLKRGDTYVDENGELITRAQLDAKLKTRGTEPIRVVRVTFRYRLTTDPIEMERRTMVVAVPVVGRLNTEELGRVVHTATRNVHKALRELGAQ